MLKDNLEGKTITIIGYQTLTGKIILKKLIAICKQLPRIIVVELGNDQAKRQKFIADSYFNPKEREVLNSQITFLPLS